MAQCTVHERWIRHCRQKGRRSCRTHFCCIRNHEQVGLLDCSYQMMMSRWKEGQFVHRRRRRHFLLPLARDVCRWMSMSGLDSDGAGTLLPIRRIRKLRQVVPELSWSRNSVSVTPERSMKITRLWSTPIYIWYQLIVLMKDRKVKEDRGLVAHEISAMVTVTYGDGTGDGTMWRRSWFIWLSQPAMSMRSLRSFHCHLSPLPYFYFYSYFDIFWDSAGKPPLTTVTTASTKVLLAGNQRLLHVAVVCGETKLTP